MYKSFRSILFLLIPVVIGAGQLSCRKMLGVPDPINSVTNNQLFQTDAQAAGAMAGIYTKMVNGSMNFSNGFSTILGSLSADDLYTFSAINSQMLLFNQNKLTNQNTVYPVMWSSAYTTIYGANSVIEGVAAATSSNLSDSARKELTGESKFVRAFCHFYLTNYFGDVPILLTVDFNKTRNLARAPQSQVYQQIVQDLKDAQSLLPKDNSAAGPNSKLRIFPNYYAATALLARTYLYMKDYANAAAQASIILNNTSQYGLDPQLNNVFVLTGTQSNSIETIWCLQQGNTDFLVQNCTVEGYTFLPNPLNTSSAAYCLTDQLLNAFEPGDQRRVAWVGMTNNSNFGGTNTITYYPYKYKTGRSNSAYYGPVNEPYTMLRVAEQYLIRAEAEANGANGGTAAAITDLNVIRARAGLGPLSSSLTSDQVIAAVAHERQVELFAEWGHRWMDLKRTGMASSVLSAISGKQPWAGDYQLLYPIPPAEIQNDHFLLQNSGY